MYIHQLKVRLLIIPLLFFMYSVNYGYAQSEMGVLEISNQDVYPIHAYLHWIETDQDLSEDEALDLFMDNKGNLLAPELTINSGITNYTYWMMFKIKNTSNRKERLFFQFNNPNLNSIDVFVKTDSGFSKLLSTGAKYPFMSRIYPYHDFVFAMEVEQGAEVSYLIKADKKSEIFSTKPELMSYAYFKAKEQNLYLVFGAILGMMLFNVIINLFLGISLKENIHFLYAVYVCAALLWLFSSIGVDFQFFFPNHPKWFNISQGITGAVTMVLMAQLTDVFLKLKERKSTVYYVLTVSKWGLAIILPIQIIVFVYFPDYTVLKMIVIHIFLIFIAGIAVGMIWAAIQRSYEGFKPAWFYLVAMFYLAFSIFKTCYIIIGEGDISELVAPPTNIQQGLIVETIIIFIGIIYRYNLFKKEKDALGIKLATERLEKANHIVEAQEEERKRLAQDLHDDLGATLSSLLLHITNPLKTNSKDVNANIWNERSIEITKKALTDLRNISHNLLPKDIEELHLFQELQNKVDSLNAIGPLEFSLNVFGDDAQLNEIMILNLYRIINELIHNVLKHANASAVNIDLIIEADRSTVTVEDNGIGFRKDQVTDGIGLRNIKSRVAFLNGEISIDINKHGTTIIIVIPI